MDYQDYVKMALDDNGEIKLILKGEVLPENNKKVGVVSVAFITRDVKLAKEKFDELNKNKKEDDYYMIYSCPENTDLNNLDHFPSIAISPEDLK